MNEFSPLNLSNTIVNLLIEGDRQYSFVELQRILSPEEARSVLLRLGNVGDETSTRGYRIKAVLPQVSGLYGDAGFVYEVEPITK